MSRLKLVINCGPCEAYISACLASVRVQHYPNWDAVVTVDPWSDCTFSRACAAAAGDPRVSITLNECRRYSMVNLIEGVRRANAAPDDIIVVLDGDDWLYDETALGTIAETYARHDCWMTYGSWISNDPSHQGMQRGLWPAYPDDTVDFRHAKWRHTAIRTWKRWLWDLVDDRDFRDESGRYFEVTEDQASMLPMLEMSGTMRARHIADVLMVYNRLTPQACGRTRYAEMIRNADLIRTRVPYRRLESRPAPTAARVPTRVGDGASSR